MNEAKLAKKEEGLNGQAKKVLDAVPLQQQWSKEKIVAEMRRTGSNAGRDVIEACLNVLRGHGLVREPVPGQFIRVEAKPKNQQPEIKIVHSISQTKPMPTQEPAKKEDALTRIAALSKSLRKLADDFDQVALDVTEQIQAIEKDTEKFRQFQAMLKSLGQ